MNGVTHFLFCNTIAAAALLLVLLVARRVNARPQLIHFLSALILLKLITPPLWSPQVAVIPRRAIVDTAEPPKDVAPRTFPEKSAATHSIDSQPSETRPNLISENGHATAESDTDASPASDSRVVTPTDVAQSGARKHAGVTKHTRATENSGETNDTDGSKSMTSATLSADGEPFVELRLPLSIAWIFGSAFLVFVSGFRVVRFRRHLGNARDCPADVNLLAKALSERIGLNRAPPVRFIVGDTPPMLCSLFCQTQIVLPISSWHGMDSVQREALLLHELAHFKRGDHYLRLLEFITTCLYWWNPVVWIARRELRRSEELCCDEIVVQELPRSRRSYAQLIIQAIDGSSSTRGSFHTAMGWYGDLSDRLTRIMTAPERRPISLPWKIVFLSAGLCFLSVLPSPTQTEANPPAQPGREVVRQVEVITESGTRPTSVPVKLYFAGRQLRTLTTDSDGRIQIPDSTFPIETWTDQPAVLWIDHPEHGCGWLDLQRQMQSPNGTSGPATIRLRKRDQIIRGRFVDKEGKPISRVAAVISSLDSPDNGMVEEIFQEAHDFGSATSDQNGNFQLTLPENATYTLRVQHPDWIGKKVFSRRAKQTHLKPIELSPAGQIKGRLMDDAGNPIAGHRVAALAQKHARISEPSASYRSVETNAQGEFSIGGLPEGRFDVIYLGAEFTKEKRPLAAQVAAVTVETGQETETRLVAKPARRLFGRVVDRQGKPISRVDVGYYGSARPESCVSALLTKADAAGEFEVFAPPGFAFLFVAQGERQSGQGASQLLEVKDRDIGPLTLKIGTRGGMEEIEEVELVPVTDQPNPNLPKKLEVKLQVPEGMKLPGQYLVRTVESEVRETRAWTLKSGKEFELDLAQHVSAPMIVIQAEGFRVAESEVIDESTAMPVPIVLNKLVHVPVSGQVLDRDGDVAPGARVRLRRRLYGTIDFPFGPEQRTDALGRFTLDQVHVGDEIQVRVDEKGTAGAESAWIKINTETPVNVANLILGSADEVLGGRVVDGQGRAVGRADVFLADLPEVRTVTSSEGTFTLKQVPAGQQFVVVSHPAKRRSRYKAEAGKRDHQFMIFPKPTPNRNESSVKVLLRTPGNRPAAHVHYFGCIEDGDHLVSWEGGGENSATWNFDYVRKEHAEKRLVVCVAAKGYRFAVTDPFEMVDNLKPIELKLEEAPPATAVGLVLDAKGNPVSGAKVGISVSLTEGDQWEDWALFNSSVKVPVTDAAGRFEIPDQYVGSRVAVYVKKEGLAGCWSERIELSRSGENRLPDVVLRPGQLSISGEIRDDAGRYVAGAVVEMMDLGTVRTKTDSKGRFEFSGLGDRKHILNVQCESGYWNGYVDSGNTNLKLHLTRGL